MNQDFVFRVADLLNKTFTTSNSSERKLAEEELEALSKNEGDYLQALLNIIASDNSSVSLQIKNSAALNVKKLIKLKDEEGKVQENAFAVAQLIFAVLISPNIEIQIRASLGYALTPIFSHENELLLSQMFPYVFTALDGQEFSVLGAFRTLRAMFNDAVHMPSLIVYFRHLLEPVLLITDKTIQKLKLNSGNIVLADILCEVSGWLTVAIEHFEITSRSALEEIKDMSILFQIYYNILTFVLEDNSLGQKALISIDQKPLHIKLNHSKSQLLQGLNLILQFTEEKKIKEFNIEEPDSYLVQFLKQIVEPLTLSLHTVVMRPDYETLLDDNYIKELFVEILVVLSKLANENKFLSFFIQNFKGIIVEICLPLIKAFREDYESIELYPEEFVNASIEICERQESDTFKTSAVELLESLAERVDGALSFMVSFACQVVSWTLTKVKHETYTYLDEFQQSKIMQSSDEQRTEVCLLMLSALSNYVIRRKDLFTTVEILIKAHLLLMTQANSNIIHQRLCMIMRYYLGLLYEKDNETFMKLIEILLGYCNSVNNHQIVSMQGADALCHILENPETMERLEPLFSPILSSMIMLIPIQNSKTFFESIQEILSSSVELVLPHLSTLIPLLVQKIQTELPSLNEPGENKKKKKTNIIIIKCWNIIRLIADVKETTVEQVLEIEKQLIPLFEYMKNPNDIEFDEDIYLFETSLMRKTKTVTEAGWVLFNLLTLVQEKFDNTFIQLFEAINCYLEFGAAVFIGNPELIGKLIEMCRKCLFAKYKKKTAERENMEAALIYQQLLHSYPQVLDPFLPSILSSAMERLSSRIKKEYFRVRLLGIILASFDYNCQLSISILSSVMTPNNDTCFDNALKQILASINHIKEPYDKKVAVKGLCNLLIQPNLPQGLAIGYEMIFKMVIQILSGTLPAEGNKMAVEGVKKSKKQKTEEQEANMILKTFLSPMSQFDEYHHFKETIKYIQTTTPSKVEGLISSLDQAQAETLKHIVKKQRVSIAGRQTQISSVRSILKPKYKAAHN